MMLPAAVMVKLFTLNVILRDDEPDSSDKFPLMVKSPNSRVGLTARRSSRVPPLKV